ncbi:MAG: alanine racemase [Puniceicoccaceae bacterium]|nr:MAG: alanine racemase [Puniceicoccaceae bacterium]
MTPPSSPVLRCWAEIDLGALERNLTRIRGALPEGIRYVSVVKADAYGHGLYQTVARLMRSGADLFAVANVHEGAAVREIGPGWKILVLGPLVPGEEPLLAEHDLVATLSSAEEAERIEAVAETSGRPRPVHLKIDTGMGRAGVWYERAPELLRRVLASPRLRLEGAYTHFSVAESDPVFTATQRNRFLDTLAAVPELNPAGLLIHADNSAGLETFAAAGPFNAVRVGLLQFGVAEGSTALLARVNPEPVFRFFTRVGLVKELPAGTGISYGRTRFLERASRVAILTAGYGDGLPLAASNRAEVLLHGQRCPVLGRVTMDQTIVDVTGLDAVRPGDTATLVGTDGEDAISLVEFSRWAGTIPYEILCSVTKRVPRIYRTAPEV